MSTPSVRAKFLVTSKSSNGEGEGGTVSLVPVVGDGTPENDSFYKYTPGGSIELSTINQSALDAFEEGKQYYVDFTAA